MVSLSSRYISTDKSVRFVLLQVFGIGPFQARSLCSKLGIDWSLEINQLPASLWEKCIHFVMTKQNTDLQLQRQIAYNIQHYVRIGSFRGFRHVEKLPVRGQRTHTNAKTCRKSKYKKML